MLMLGGDGRREMMLACLMCACACVQVTCAAVAALDTDNEQSRKVIGSSVVTSVSVIMDHGNGSKTYITDAAGQPIDQTEGAVGSPVDLLNPDRYEFYTFDETGDLVKKLMTLDQIKGLLAGGDGETLDKTANSPTFFHDSLTSTHLDDSDLEPDMVQGVHNVVANVQNVLRSELEASKVKPTTKPPLHIPDSISSWSMLFPAIVSDAEALADSSENGNSVNNPIDSSDRLPASSIIQNTEIKVNPEDMPLKNSGITIKPTAVPPIIHFLEIKSVPTKKVTKAPVNNTSTTSVTEETTVMVHSTTTETPKSQVNSINEMSASISNILQHMSNTPSIFETLNTSSENEFSMTTASYVEKINKSPPNISEMEISIKVKNDTSNTESSNVEDLNSESNMNIATEIAIDTVSNHKYSNTSKSTRPNTEISSTTLSVVDKIKTPTDLVVNRITTLKPLSITKSDAIKVISAEKEMAQKDDHTTLSPSIANNKNHKINISNNPAHVGDHKDKIDIINSTSLKNAVVPNEKLETDASEDILKIVPTKPSERVTDNKPIKNGTQVKIKDTNNTSTIKLSNKPHKKVPSSKPHHSEDAVECSNAKKTSNDTKFTNTENANGAASTNVNKRISPTKLKGPSVEEVKSDMKQSMKDDKQTVSKIKTTEHVKVTTYKPSTSQPFTTKQATDKISTTTEQPFINLISSETKVHVVNSSLFNLKNQEIQLQNISNPLAKSKENVTENETGSHINDVAEAVNIVSTISDEELRNIVTNKSVPVPYTNLTENSNHTMEVECKHAKPIKSPTEDLMSNGSDDVTTRVAEDVKSTTTIPTTIKSTSADSLKEYTTQQTEENTTQLKEDDQTTESSNLITEFSTTHMPEIDFVKEGISAVTNILLDFNPLLEPQLPFPTIPLEESASNSVQSPPVKGELKHASFDGLEMTSTDMVNDNVTQLASIQEKETLIYFTTLSPTKEMLSTATYKSEEDSLTTTSISGAEITENMTETTTTTDEYTTFQEEFGLKKKNEQNKIPQLKNNQTLPTKESKLSTENESVESPCNHTLIASQFNKTANGNHIHNITNNTEPEDYLKSAQSIIKEVTKTNSNSKLELTTSTQSSDITAKTNHNSGNVMNEFKQDKSKLSLGKLPNIQNQLTPIKDRPVNHPTAVELHPAPHENMGLEATTSFLADDVRRFSDLCNELAFRMWTSITGKGSISSRSLVLSPFATTSLLAMVFLGARGPTSGQMNDVLRLDDMVTFNPHQVLQNVTESVLNSRNYGVTTAAFVRELYSDKLKGKILDFYKERAQQYYDGHVEEISFNTVGDILRRRTNLLIKRQTLGKIPEYLRGSNLILRPPLAAFSANIFQTDCDLASTEGRDGEMYFVVRPSTRQRRLVPVPAAVWRTGFLAGYEPALDATAVALGTDSVVSTVLILPGQQGQVAPGDGLARLEQRLIETSYRRGGWTRLLRSLLPRPGLELQVPRFSHRSVLNVTSTLQRMGLKDLFNEQRADLRGLNGLSNDLHLSEMVQVNTFSTCGEDTIGARHHIETYPMSPQRMGRDDPELYPRPEDFDDPEIFKVPLNLRPRQARLPDNPRLRFDRPFLYMVRHNPTGMILHMGRFNPRLLP